MYQSLVKSKKEITEISNNRKTIKEKIIKEKAITEKTVKENSCEVNMSFLLAFVHSMQNTKLVQKKLFFLSETIIPSIVPWKE